MENTLQTNQKPAREHVWQEEAIEIRQREKESRVEYKICGFAHCRPNKFGAAEVMLL